MKNNYNNCFSLHLFRPSSTSPRGGSFSACPLGLVTSAMACPRADIGRHACPEPSRVVGRGRNKSAGPIPQLQESKRTWMFLFISFFSSSFFVLNGGLRILLSHQEVATQRRVQKQKKISFGTHQGWRFRPSYGDMYSSTVAWEKKQ